MRKLILAYVGWFAILMAGFPQPLKIVHAADAPAPKKIVLIAGKKSHGPEGNGIHDYPWSVKLLKVMLDNSNVAGQVRVEYHLDGWPDDEKTLEDAAAILIISDGRDGDLFAEAPHFATEEHRQQIAKQIDRGCGFLTFHFSTFAPDQYAEDIQSWSGGYFDWETDGKKQWYSAIKTLDAEVQLATPDHPVLRGVTPFKLREEFYYNIRFGSDDKSLVPLWRVPAVEGRAEQGDIVAWAKERPDGGRGFGTTCGHFYDNWEQANFRKLILNALLWAAKGNVPADGVEARYFTHAEITAALAGKPGTERAVVDDKPIKALIMTGHQYPGHLWKETTPALKEALLRDPRISVDVSENIEDFATDKISGYDLLVLNYCNWEKPGLSDAAKAGFVKYLQAGGGLIIIHFSNGAFHFSLPKAGESDWPEFRKICRRAWDHTPNKSGHDAYGKFVVEIAKADHPITPGMEPFETIDELYFRQQGEEPIEVLLSAKSTVTGRDEPMAFVYNYGKGRVMQTVLGHAAESLRTPGASELIRRSAAWVAQREQTLAVSQAGGEAAKPQATMLVEGRFGNALDARVSGLLVAGHEVFRTSPLTVECWARLSNKANYNILLAQELKTSATHWELFTMTGNGRLTAYLPGMQPDHVNSEVDIVDDQWHHLAMVYEPQRVRLYVDGKPVADQAVEFQNGKTIPGPLAIGKLVDQAIGCTGLIDDVRISQSVREITLPEQPPAVEKSTLGLWRFDDIDDQGRSPDASAHQRPAAVSVLEKKAASSDAFFHWSKEIVGFDWTEQDSVDNRWSQTDVGPFLASIVPMPGQPPVTKGLSIKVGDNASVCYDTQTMALRSVWTGGFLKFDPARYGIIAAPQMDGELQFLSSPDAGWVAKEVKYRGLTSRFETELQSEIDGVPISESTHFHRMEEQRGLLARSLEIGKPHDEMRYRLGRFTKLSPARIVGDWHVVTAEGEKQSITGLIPRQNSAHWETQGDELQFVIEPAAEKDYCSMRLAIGPWTDADLETMTPHKAGTQISNRIVQAKKSGDSSFDVIQTTTRGTLGKEPGPYQVDTLTIPFDNDAQALLFVTGHDFFSNGDLAVCTLHGDIWHVSGVDQTLDTLRWQRIAAGLFQPLGLRIVNDEIYVLGRDRITRLIVDRDDEADEEGYLFAHVDRYENFCDLYETSPGGHDYVTCLETDPEGNFYFTHAKHGVQKISKDGKTLETVATGLRNPNGLSVSPTGEITATPQEGEWTPASAIFMVRPGDHFGYGGPRITPQRPLGYDPPLCWIPRLVDNSSASQCWTPDDTWGLPANSLLHFSFGQCQTQLALREQVDGVWQGGVIPLPWKFDSGLSRGRFSPHDGHLYVSGLKGWVTSAVQDGCLQRVRYVVGDPLWPIKMQTYQNGIALTFGCRLDKQAAEDPDNYGVQACNYRYAPSYGSPDLRPSQSTVEGRDDWEVASVTLRDDERTVFLELPDLTPVMQVVINWTIPSADQTALANSYNGTIHRLPTESFDVPESSRKPRSGRLTKDEEAALVPGVLFTLQQSSHLDVFPARTLALEIASHQLPNASWDPGSYSFIAEGFLKVPISGSYSFRLADGGDAELRINDSPVVESTTVVLRKGYNRVSLMAASSSESDSALRLLWQSDTFAEEPVPPTAWYREGRSEQAGNVQRWQRGRELFETRQCLNCHHAGIADTKQNFVFQSPSLKNLGSRMTERWLTAWLLNPREVRHGAEMPALFDEQQPTDRQAAADLAAFLLQEQKPAGEQREFAVEPAAGELLYEELGCIACHRFTPPAEQDAWQRTTLHFAGEKFPAGALAQYLQQPQRHHKFSRMPDFHLTNNEADALVDLIFTRSTGKLHELAETSKAQPERGAQIFREMRCGQCHELWEPAAAPASRIPFPDAVEGLSRGCLAEKAVAGRNAPAFSLTADDRMALRYYLETTDDIPSPMSHSQQTDHLVRRLNCTACHHRDHTISPLGEIIAEESERGIPPASLPNLTLAGEKLQVDWMRKLFRGEHPRKTRPWLKARMPAFPAYAESLADGLAAEHGLPSEPEASATVNVELAEIGRRLMLKDKGLDCRQCHAVAGQQPTGDEKTKIAPGVDFAETKHRLRAEFYHRFVLDPPRTDVTIRMPKFALDGKTTPVAQVFEGNASRQFEAIWHHIRSLPDTSPADATE